MFDNTCSEFDWTHWCAFSAHKSHCAQIDKGVFNYKYRNHEILNILLC